MTLKFYGLLMSFGGKWSPKAPNTNKHEIMQRRSWPISDFVNFTIDLHPSEVRIQTWIKNAKTSRSIHLYRGLLRGRCSKNMVTATLKDFGLSIGTIGNCKKNPLTLRSKTRAVTLTGAVAIMGCWTMGGRTWAGKYMASGCGQFLNMYVINDLAALPFLLLSIKAFQNGWTLAEISDWFLCRSKAKRQQWCLLQISVHKLSAFSVEPQFHISASMTVHLLGSDWTGCWVSVGQAKNDCPPLRNLLGMSGIFWRWWIWQWHPWPQNLWMSH